MLLALSIVALLAGPMIYTYGRRNRIARQILDGFIFITIAGIVTVHIIPEALIGGGDLAIVLNYWGPQPNGHPADINNDGFVGPPDLSQVLGAWSP